MKNILIAISLLILGFSASSWAHENVNTVSMQLTPEGKLSANKTSKVTVKLTDIATGKLVGEKDLKIAHTKKLHLLIIDPSLTDYQHIHPIETKTSGEFTFDFTPKKDGMYRIWADIKPIKTDTQEYVIADMGDALKDTPTIDKTTNMEAVVDGYKFKLLFDSELAAGKASLGTLKVEDKDGKEVTKLEPVLGAFAHIVGFSENFKSVAHVHPMGKEPESDAERGGPELTFHVEPKTNGFTKLFAQLKIDGKDIFVPFGLNVNNSLASK